VVSYRQLRQLGYDLDITLQVELDWAPSNWPNGSLDDFTNHSCDANTGIRLTDRGTIVLALRDIAAHEELTYDYSTYSNNPYENLRWLVSRGELPGRGRQSQHFAGRA
jgi:SET domain